MMATKLLLSGVSPLKSFVLTFESLSFLSVGFYFTFSGQFDDQLAYL